MPELYVTQSVSQEQSGNDVKAAIAGVVAGFFALLQYG
jgi:hypothetical protein